MTVSKDDRNGSKAGWRKSTKQVTPKGTFWSKKTAKSNRGLSNRTKLYLSFVSVLVLGGTLAFYLSRDDRPTWLLVCSVNGYDYPWPANSWSAEDAAQFQQVLPIKSKFTRCAVADDRDQREFADWLKVEVEKKNLSVGGPGGGIVFQRYGAISIYLSAHAMLNEQDEPCLLFPTKLAGDATSNAWYHCNPTPLKAILQSICDKVDQEFKRGILVRREANRVLVFLDIERSPTLNSLGWNSSSKLHRRIEEVIKGLDNDNLAVLTSCGANERSWAVPELGGSIFARSVAEAIHGEADRMGKRDSRITVQEIIAYVQKTVELRANAIYAEHQTPHLYSGSGQPTDKINFEVAYASTDKIAGRLEKQVNTASLGEIDSLWKDFGAQSDALLRLDPWKWNELRNRILHAEQLLWAGPSDLPILKNDFEVIRSMLQSPMPAWPSEIVDGQSTASDKNDDGLIKILTDDQRKLAYAWLNQTTLDDGKQLDSAPKLREPQAYALVWTWIRQQVRFDHEQLRRCEEVLTRSKEGDTKNPIARQWLLLNSLIQGLKIAETKPESQERMISSIPKLLNVFQSIDELFQISDPRLSRWLDRPNQLSKTMFNAIDYWQLGTIDGLTEFDNLLKSLVGTNSKEGLVDLAKVEKKQLELSWQIFDRAAIAIPNLGSISLRSNQLPSGMSLQTSKVAFAESHRGLISLVDALTAEQLNLEELRKLTNSIKLSIDAITEFREATKLANVQDSIEPLKRRDLILWLEQPFDFGGEVRVKLRSKLAEVFNDKNKISWDIGQKSGDSKNANRESDASATSTSDSAKGSSSNTDDDPWKKYIADAWQPLLGNGNDDPSKILKSETLTDHSIDFRSMVFRNQTTYGSDSITLANELNRPDLLAKARKEIIELSWKSRWLAPFVIDSQISKISCPTRHHWALSAQLAMVARAEQSVNDFWVNPHDAPTDDEHYATLARNYLQLAKSLPRNAGAKGFADDALLKQSEQEIVDKSKLSKKWANTIWTGLPIEAAKTPSIQWPIVASSFESASIIRGGFSGSPMMLRRVTPGDVAPSPSVTIDVTKPLAAFHRGRSSSKSIAKTASKTIPEFAWSLPRSNVKVQLNSKSPPRQILFLLDCSESFAKVDHDNAKQAIIELLQRMPDNYEVGLVAFGHRRIWIRDIINGVVSFKSSEKKPNPKPNPNETPENDMENLVAIGPNSVDQKQRFVESLEGLTPVGFTPLYYSIDESRKVLAKVRKASFTQHLVVVSDGADNVYRAKFDGKGEPWTEIPLDKRRNFFSKKTDQIRKDIAADNLQLQVIKYVFSADVGDPAGIEQLTSKDKIFDANDRMSLRSSFAKIVGIRDYAITFGNEKPIVENFGKAVSYNVTKKTPVRIQVVETTDKLELSLTGGEKLAIAYDDATRKFHFRQEDELAKAEHIVELQNGDKKISYVVSMLTRDKKIGTDYIRMGIRPDRDDQLPPLRPNRLWVELQIVPEGEREARSIGLSNVLWEEEKNHPIFRVPVQKAVAKKARLWLAWDDGQPDSIYLSEWESDGNPLKKLGMSRPEVSGDSAPWTISLSVPPERRLRWIVEPAARNDATNALKSISYAMDPIEPKVKYTFVKKPDDIRLLVEEMPAADRPNTQGWITTEWLEVPE